MIIALEYIPKTKEYLKLMLINTHLTVGRLFAVMYLNDVDVGGETEFPDWNIAVKPEKGKVLLFPCNYLFKHKGNVPFLMKNILLLIYNYYTKYPSNR